MKYTKTLSLSLLLFTLLGCNQAPQESQTNNNIEISNTIQQEKSSPQKVAQNNPKNKNNIEVATISQTQDSSPTKVEKKVKASTLYQTENSPSKSETIAQTEQPNLGKGRIIGSANCDDDGLEDDVRVDYDGDGRADKCVVANLPTEDEIEPLVNETSYKTVMNSLQLLTGDCKETQKKQGNIKYTICKNPNKIVKASESHAEFGDGIGFWFFEGKLIAAQRFHNGELFVFDYDGKLTSMFAENPKTGKIEKLASIRNQDRKDAEENLYNGYQNIFKVFNL